MATRNFISQDFANRLERARRKTQHAPSRHILPSVSPDAPPPQVTGMFRVYNNANDTIPENAVMQVEDFTERTGWTGANREAYSVKQYDGDGRFFLVNAGSEIREGRFGSGILLTEPNKVLIDPDVDDPAFLDSFGPVEDEWHLGPSGIGYLWLGQQEENDDGTETAIFIAGIPPDGVIFRNDATETFPKHGVGRITGDEAVNGNSVTKIVKPDTTFSREYLINGPKDIEAGAFGVGYLMEGKKRKVLYDTGTPAYGEGWGPKPSQWSISKGYYGFTIFGNNDTEGLTTHASASPIDEFFGKLNGTLSQGGTQGVSVWAGDGGSEADISGMDVTCRDWFMKSGATAIASGKKVRVRWRLNAYYIVLAECP